MAGIMSLFQMLGFTSGGEDEMNSGTRYESEIEDEEEDEEDEDEEDENEDEEGRSVFSFPFGFSFFGHRNDDDSQEDEESEEQTEDEEEVPRKPKNRQKNSKVIDYQKSKERRSNPDDDMQRMHREHIIVVRQLGDSRTIITHLHNGDSVILNLENIDPKDCGRVIDLLSGAAFALGGNIIKVSRLTYLLAPGSVKVIPPQSAPASSRFTL